MSPGCKPVVAAPALDLLGFAGVLVAAVQRAETGEGHDQGSKENES